MNDQASKAVHASAVAIDGHGVLISGPSGSGKSDLALRLIDRGAKLISDDITNLSRAAGEVVISSPENIVGNMEVRSLGIVPFDHVSDIPLKLQVNLVNEVDRFPMDSQKKDVMGHRIATIAINALEASAPIKVELALKRVLENTEQL